MEKGKFIISIECTLRAGTNVDDCRQCVHCVYVIAVKREINRNKTQNVRVRALKANAPDTMESI